jgi:hypothetical protein
MRRFRPGQAPVLFRAPGVFAARERHDESLGGCIQQIWDIFGVLALFAVSRSP